MLNVGDFVTHIGFPPAEGVIVGIQKSNVSPDVYRVCVNENSRRLIWGDSTEWELLTNVESIDADIIDVDASGVV